MKLWVQRSLIDIIYNLNSKIFSCKTISTLLNLLCILFLTSKTKYLIFYNTCLFYDITIKFLLSTWKTNPHSSLAHISCGQIMQQLHFACLWPQHYKSCHKYTKRQLWRSNKIVDMKVTGKFWSAERKWERNLVLNCWKCAYPCLLNYVS